MSIYDLSDHEVVAQTIQWCNEIHESKGMEPIEDLPKGTREDPSTCPCGLATGVDVDYESYTATESGWIHGGERYPLPAAVRQFVRAFDNEQFPQYDIEFEFDTDDFEEEEL